VISAIEHASVSEPAAELARAGFEIVQIPVDDQGLVQIDALRASLSEDTILVSIMAANNETGVLEPIAKIGQLIREHSPSASFHTDATQAIGKIDVNLQSDWQDVDFLSFSGHKFHGPKGIGGLYIRQGIELEAMLLGGGQQRGQRSGTINTPALAGLASAAAEAINLKIDKISNMRDIFETRLLEALPGTQIHSKSVARLPNTSFFSLVREDGEEVAERLAASGIIVGTGAACSSGAIEGSKTLRSMGVPHSISSGGLRVSLSKFSTIAELDALLSNILHGSNRSGKIVPVNESQL
jgi:cysteine desulfurase